MTTAPDDGIVVVMEKRITTTEYFSGDESNRPAELVYGFVREPPTPYFGHQTVVGRMFRLLSAHVEARCLGAVCVSPMDVVLDNDAGVIVQPDLLFISHERAGIIRNHVWGAPDLVVEVASPGTAHYDGTVKLSWYRKYGVRECWLVYEKERKIAIVDCASSGETTYTGAQVIGSQVLPGLELTPDACFS